jgi:hypothetical protein
MSGGGSYKDEPGYEYHRNECFLGYTRQGFKGASKEDIKKDLDRLKAAAALSRTIFDEKMAKLDEKFMPDITRNENVIEFSKEACNSIEKDPAVVKWGKCLTDLRDMVAQAEEAVDEAKSNEMPDDDLNKVKAFLADRFIPACLELDPTI